MSINDKKTVNSECISNEQFYLNLYFTKEAPPMNLINTKRQDGLFIFKEATHYNRLKLEYKDGLISFIFDIKGNKDEAFGQIIDFIKLLISHNLEKN